MSDPVSAARSARETLARALAALQTPGVPETLLAAAEPVARAMSSLHRVESSGGAAGDAGAQALNAARQALATLQPQAGRFPAVDQAMEAIAGSLGVIHRLAGAAPAAALAPAAAPASPFAGTVLADRPQPPPMPPVGSVTQPSQPMFGGRPEPPPQVAVAQPGSGGGAPAAPPRPAAGAQQLWRQTAPSPIAQPAPKPAAQPAPAAPPQQWQQPAPAAAPQQWQQPAAAAPPQQWQQPAPAAAAPPQQWQQPAAAAPPQQWQQPAPTAVAPPQQWQQPAAAAPPQQWQQPAPAAAPGPPPMPANVPPGAVRVEAALGAHSATNFYKGLSGNDVVDSGGIFVATYNIPDVGAALSLRVSMPGGYEFEALGIVRWTREAPNSGSDSPPGFGAQFTQISAEARQLIYRYVRNREPLFHDDL